jgi:hypothetical protein
MTILRSLFKQVVDDPIGFAFRACLITFCVGLVAHCAIGEYKDLARDWREPVTVKSMP